MAKVVVLAHRIPFPPNKGEKLRTFHQIEELVRKGHHVTVMAPVSDEADNQNASALAQHFNIKVVCKPLPHKIVRLLSAVLYNSSFSEANFYSKALQRELAMQSANADTILFTASSLAKYANVISKRSGVKLLMDFMDVDSDKWSQYASQSNILKAWIYKRESKKVKALEIEVAKRFKTCFLIADTEKRLFAEQVLNTPNIEVLGNGIDTKLFSPNAQKPSTEVNFLFSGVMDYKPNIDAILWFVDNCWADIQKSVPNAKLIIAGMNPSAKITKLGLSPNIDVTGFVDDIKPYFDKAHVFIAPFQIARGVQNKVLQAMACALPVVSTSLGAEGIMCKDSVDILIANTSSDFTQKVITVANDSELQTSIGQNALATINSYYAWESVLLPLTEAVASE
jgi:sugar transferase (PEP-CTERM/EpsH1 system associated)